MRALRCQHQIKKNFPTDNNPQFNGVAERAFGIIEMTQQAAQIHVPTRFPNIDSSTFTGSPSAEATRWTSGALKRTATIKQRQQVARRDLAGEGYSASTLFFHEARFLPQGSGDKNLMKAAPCFYMRPAPNHPRGAMRILTKGSRKLVTTRDITRLNVLEKAL